jgi:Domain of unknown function (DUF6895)
VQSRRQDYLTALHRARAWLDRFDVDPATLREHGFAGKKKLVEQVEAYYELWRVAAPTEKPDLVSRVRQLVAVTHEKSYHDMLVIDDDAFKADSTSYLRCAVLMERLGLDTRFYRTQIALVLPRLNRDMTRRGPNQRRIFHAYYQHFGLAEPFRLDDALKKGLIASRKQPSTFKHDDIYTLTHEVYAVYDYGERLDSDGFGREDEAYLRATIPVLAGRYLAKNDADIVAELLECAHYLRMSDEPIYETSLSYLLRSQNADGSWGRYEHLRERYGPFVREGFYLHTTMVVIGALARVFDHPMPDKTRR